MMILTIGDKPVLLPLDLDDCEVGIVFRVLSEAHPLDEIGGNDKLNEKRWQRRPGELAVSLEVASVERIIAAHEGRAHPDAGWLEGDRLPAVTPGSPITPRQLFDEGRQALFSVVFESKNYDVAIPVEALSPNDYPLLYPNGYDLEEELLAEARIMAEEEGDPPDETRLHPDWEYLLGCVKKYIDDPPSRFVAVTREAIRHQFAGANAKALEMAMDDHGVPKVEKTAAESVSRQEDHHRWRLGRPQTAASKLEVQLDDGSLQTADCDEDGWHATGMQDFDVSRILIWR